MLLQERNFKTSIFMFEYPWFSVLFILLAETCLNFAGPLFCWPQLESSWWTTCWSIWVTCIQYICLSLHLKASNQSLICLQPYSITPTNYKRAFEKVISVSGTTRVLYHCRCNTKFWMTLYKQNNSGNHCIAATHSVLLN